MTIEQLCARLETWKRFVWIGWGASASLLAGAASDLFFTSRRADVDQFTSWLSVWLLVQLVSVLPAIRLTAGREWRTLPLSFRLNVIFGSLAASWAAMFSFGLRLQRMIDSSPRGILFFTLLLGLALAGIYLHLRRQLFTAPESIFP